MKAPIRAGGLVLAAAVLGSLSAPLAAHQAEAAPTQIADDGLGTTGTTTYAVDPAGRVIHVSVDLTATNLVPGTSRGYTYYDALRVFTLAEATNLAAATAAGQSLAVSLQPIEDSTSFAFVEITLPNQLLHQETDAIHLTYDLPDQGPRSGRITRVNPAFAAVLPLPFGDPGAAEVRVLVPDAFDVEVLGLSDMANEDAGDQQALVAAGIADPVAFDASVIVRDSDALERAEVGGEHDVSVASWPGDTDWQTFVSALVRDGLPAMEERIGQPWPVDGTLDIIETVAPYLYGYAGWYDGSAEQIEIGDELDSTVVLHELAHAWFNDELFAERWINEGLAEELASTTLAQLGQEGRHPQPIDGAASGAMRLVDWSTPLLSSTISDDAEAFGYNASFAVMRELSEEIGVESLALVIDAAADDEIAYQGDPEPEAWTSATDWRRFLDLLEEVGGSTGAVDLFSTYVVPEPDLPDLLVRSEARRALAALEEAGTGWTAPLAVRHALAAWEFERAGSLIEEATDVLATRDAIAATVAPLGLDVPRRLEDAYEQAEDLDRLAEDADAFLAAAGRLVAVTAEVGATGNLLERIGRIGTSVEDDLAAAEDAFATDDTAAVEDALDDTVTGLDGAGHAGAERVGAVFAVLLLVVAGFGLHRARAARRRATLDVVVATPPPVSSPWSPPTPPPSGYAPPPAWPAPPRFDDPADDAT